MLSTVTLGQGLPQSPKVSHPFSGKSKWGLSKWGLKVLVHNCPRLPTIVVILRRKFPLERGPKRPQKCTIVDDCARIAESGLKPPFESPHLDFPEKGCSHSAADSPGARTLVFAAFEPFHSCEFRASIARTPFCAILWRWLNLRKGKICTTPSSAFAMLIVDFVGVVRGVRGPSSFALPDPDVRSTSEPFSVNNFGSGCF